MLDDAVEIEEIETGFISTLKNNLFNYATKELSQDAFICWLMSYALPDAEPDSALRECALTLLKLFVPEFEDDSPTLMSVEKQIHHIDVLLTASCKDKTYKIVVEDKTNTSEHGKQLWEYIATVNREYPNSVAKGVYYKTGFQSNLSGPKEAGYNVIMLESILPVLGSYVARCTNRIFIDYYEYWNNYYLSAKAYKTLPISLWHTPQALCFYNDLKAGGFAERLNTSMGFGYVPNKKGGFVGMWVGTDSTPIQVQGKHVTLSLQVQGSIDEVSNEFKCLIFLKLGNNEDGLDRECRRNISNQIIYDEYGKYRAEKFCFKRPKRLSYGTTMSIGVYNGKQETNYYYDLLDALSDAFKEYSKFLVSIRDVFQD